MEIFIIIELILFFFVYNYSSINKDSLFYIVCMLFFVLTGLHDGQEYCDFPEYMNLFIGKSSMYGTLNNTGYELESPYYIFCKLLGLFGRTEFVYILGIALMFGIPFMWLTKRKSNNYALTLFLLLILSRGHTYLIYLAAHRQMLATAFMIIALLLYESDIKRKNLLSVACLFIAVIGHSSSYFVVPILLGLYFFKFEIKSRIMLAICWGSMILGVTLSNYWGVYLQTFFAMLEGVESVSRTTNYLNYEIYEMFTSTTYLNLLPLTLLTSVMVYFKDEDSDPFYLNCMFIACVVYNLLSVVPLINRSVTVLLFMGIIGAIPSALNYDRRCKIAMLFAILLNWYVTYKWYVSDDFRLPFNFIWS